MCGIHIRYGGIKSLFSPRLIFSNHTRLDLIADKKRQSTCIIFISWCKRFQMIYGFQSFRRGSNREMMLNQFDNSNLSWSQVEYYIPGITSKVAAAERSDEMIALIRLLWMTTMMKRKTTSQSMLVESAWTLIGALMLVLPSATVPSAVATPKPE